MLQLSIVIISYNVKYFLEQCLCSVQKAIEKIEAQVLVVDNCSSDGSVDYIRENFSWVQLIANNKNEGFARANNIAFNQCEGDYVLCLNPDTIITEDVLQNCLKFFNIHENAGAVGVRMIDGAGNFLPESKRSLPSITTSFFKLSGLSSLFPKSEQFNKYALGFLSENEVHEVDVLCGAFLMVEKSILQKLKGFDEAFFMYGEDIDLCYRIQKGGSKIYYLGADSIIHFKGESSRKGNVNYVSIFYEAMNIFLKKHYSKEYAWPVILLLKTGIYTRASMSLIMSPLRAFKKQISNKTKEEENGILLIGDKISMAEAEEIIRKNMPEATINKTEQLIETHSPDQIVFCSGALSYQKCIQFLSKAKDKKHYMWHGLNTKSVIGSRNKKLTGVVYTLED